MSLFQSMLPNRIHLTSDLVSLHIGDKILEVNGTPVRDAPLENVEQLIKNSGKVLQLTIEHDPESINWCHLGRTTCESQRCKTVYNSCNHVGNGNENSVLKERSPSPNKFDKERIFKKKDEGYISGTSRKLQKRMKDVNCNNGITSFKNLNACVWYKNFILFQLQTASRKKNVAQVCPNC